MSFRFQIMPNHERVLTKFGQIPYDEDDDFYDERDSDEENNE